MFFGVKLVVLLAYLFIGYKWNQKNNTSLALKIVFWVVLIRLILASLHEVTFSSVIAGQSLISLFSLFFVSITGFYLAYIKYPVFRSKSLLSVKLFILVLAISGMLSSILPALVEVIKWVLMINVIYLIYISSNTDGLNVTIKALVLAYIYPVILLILSIAFGEVKASEADGSRSYIGGFSHEASFSVVIYTTTALLLMYASIVNYSLARRMTLFVVMIFALLLVNYRTTFLAGAASFIVYYLCVWLRSGKNFQAISVLLVVVFLGALPFLSMGVSGTWSDRFSEIPLFFEQLDKLLVPYDYYYDEDGKFFSGRLMIWNQYLVTWYEAGLKEHLIGFGPGGWKDIFSVYAHNTFVSILFELGAVGFIISAAVFTSSLYIILKCSNPALNTTIFPFFVGFLVLNLATMPLWQIEGMLLLGLMLSLSMVKEESLESKAI